MYDDEFLSDLTGLLIAGAVKKTDDDPLDFQVSEIVQKKYYEIIRLILRK